MPFKAAAITPFISPGEVEKNAASTLEAVLKAEKAGARLIVLPKNCFFGEGGFLSGRQDVSDAVLNAACGLVRKTRACLCFGIAFLGAQIGIIADRGEIKAVKLLEGNQEACRRFLKNNCNRLIADGDLNANGKLNTDGEYKTDGYLIKIEGENVLNICGENYAADINKIYRLDDKIYKQDESPSPLKKILAIPASYPALLGGRETKLREAAVLSQANDCTIAVCCGGNGESTTKYVRSGDKIIAENGQILSCADFDAEAAFAALSADEYSTQIGYNGQNNDNNAQNYVNNAQNAGNIGHSEYNMQNEFNAQDNNAQDNNAQDNNAQGDCPPFAQQNKPNGKKQGLKLPDYTPRYLPKKDEITGVLDIISRGIAGRIREAGAKKVIFGLSGGLDSAMTLISALNAQKYGLNPADIICVTMPSRVSSRRTRTNADRLIKATGVTGLNLPIWTAVERHLKQINHAEKDVVFENAQARERAQILLDLGNKYNALTLGTSDLSESALGFSTFGGDSLAHYNPNSSLTKGAIRFILGQIAKSTDFPLPADAKKTLKSILNTPVSPELIKNQRTEDILGDYRLHDYFLLSFMAYGEAGRVLIDGAEKAFKQFDKGYIQKTYGIFISRFFKARFKTDFACDGVMLTPFDFTDKKFNSGIKPELFY